MTDSMIGSTAHTVRTRSTIVVVDAGTKPLPFADFRGRDARTKWEATYDPETATVTAYRDAGARLLHHRPMCPVPPLTPADADRIAESVEHDALRGSRGRKLHRFYGDAEEVARYVEEVAAELEHPAWCERRGCWTASATAERFPPVEHRRVAGVYEWECDGIDHSVTALLAQPEEAVTVSEGEPAPPVELRISVAGDPGAVSVIGWPEQIRRLGAFIAAAAEDLDRELSAAGAERERGRQ